MARMKASGFSELQKQLEAVNERLQKAQFDDFCQTVAKELAARLLAQVIRRTPVGKKPRIAAQDKDDKKALGGVDAKKTLKVKGSSGKSRSMLSREGAILEQHWAGYMGGTLRRGWTSKTEAEARSGGGKGDAVAYANSLPITKSGKVFEIEIINPVHYASYVEYGHRQTPDRFVPALGKRLKQGWVKGRFMLTLSEKAIQKQAPGIVEKLLKKHLEEVFNDN